MDCAVIYSQAALADLQEITEFVAKDNAEVAARFANRLVDLTQSLRSLPEHGRLTTDGESNRLLLGRNLNTDGKHRVANVMFSREFFTAPERFLSTVR